LVRKNDSHFKKRCSMSLFKKFFTIFSFFSLCLAANSKEEERSAKKALFEAGLFGGAVQFSLYPGSGEYGTRTLLFPYLFYRGKIFRSDRRGTRARIYKKDDWTFGLGFGGNIGSRSSESSIREGMPELDLVFEIGPRIRKFNLFKNKNLELGFSLKKANLFKGIKLYSQGYTLQGSLSLRRPFEMWGKNIFFTRLSFKLADELYQDYFYTVPKAYEKPGRPAYQAKGGVLGMRYFAGLQKPIFKGKWINFFGITLQEYSLAANKNSPLHTHDLTYNLIYGFRVGLYESKSRGYE